MILKSMRHIRNGISLLLLCAAVVASSRPMLAQHDPSATSPQISVLSDGIELTDSSSLLDVQILENRLVRVHVRPEGKEPPRTLAIDRILCLSAGFLDQATGMNWFADPRAEG